MSISDDHHGACAPAAFSGSPPDAALLLLGGGGLLGRAVAGALRRRGWTFSAPAHAVLDLLDDAALREALRQWRPAVVINCAGWSDVDSAEAQPDAAEALNHWAVASLVRGCDAMGASLVHFSTDYVFDGERDTPYGEGDAPHPLSVYGRTKLAGEQAVLASGGPHLVLRVSSLYGAGGRSFFSQVGHWLQQPRELPVTVDQVSTPNSVRVLAETLCCVLAQGSGDLAGHLARHRGLYHLSASGQASRYVFAQAVMQVLGPRAVARLRPVSAAQFQRAAARPAFSVLLNQRFAQTFGVALPDWRAGVRAAVWAEQPAG